MGKIMHCFLKNNTATQLFVPIVLKKIASGFNVVFECFVWYDAILSAWWTWVLTTQGSSGFPRGEVGDEEGDGGLDQPGGNRDWGQHHQSRCKKVRGGRSSKQASGGRLRAVSGEAARGGDWHQVLRGWNWQPPTTPESAQSGKRTTTSPAGSRMAPSGTHATRVRNPVVPSNDCNSEINSRFVELCINCKVSSDKKSQYEQDWKIAVCSVNKIGWKELTLPRQRSTMSQTHHYSKLSICFVDFDCQIIPLKQKNCD